jgi:CheY-like chemotaxis protein
MCGTRVAIEPPRRPGMADSRVGKSFAQHRSAGDEETPALGASEPTLPERSRTMESCADARCLAAMSTSEPSGGRRLARAARPIRVLVVDDDRDLRGAVADLLRFEGLEAAEAENGLEALLHLRTVTPSPDVVLLDLAMPVMSGWELRQAQLRDERLTTVPVVILSARPPEGLSADAVLAKPCTPEALLAAIRKVAGDRAATATARR